VAERTDRSGPAALIADGSIGRGARQRDLQRAVAYQGCDVAG
jgi:hypothetical protein